MGMAHFKFTAYFFGIFLIRGENHSTDEINFHLYYCCHNNKFSVTNFSVTNNSDMSSETF